MIRLETQTLEMNKFIPFNNKIQVKPFLKESNIASDQEPLIQAGEVIAVGKDVTFCTVGEIIEFDAWGCQKTTDHSGEAFYVVPEDKNVLIGKYGSAE